MDMEKIAPLFAGWNDTMIWSCLQGYMGAAFVDDEARPTAALIELGDFGFFAGRPNEALVKRASAPILVPRSGDWEHLIEEVWGCGAQRILRYATKKEPEAFDRARLTAFTGALPPDFTLGLFDRAMYDMAAGEAWSADLCGQFASWEDYAARGLGVGVLHKGTLVAGASSYSVYRDGIEIEIDTKTEFRRRGLAAACGARLILECLNRGLYPSWDAHDLRSLTLAEKLGYHMDRPYAAFLVGGSACAARGT